MSTMMNLIERGVERDDYTAEEFRECAEVVLEMREAHPDAWSTAIITEEETLQAIVENKDGA